MSDIVERLRKLHESGYPPLHILSEAADEIERLHERNSEHEARYEALDVLNDVLRARNAELEAVIEAALRGTPGWEDAADAALAREGK